MIRALIKSVARETAAKVAREVAVETTHRVVREELHKLAHGNRLNGIIMETINRPGVILKPWVFARVAASEMMRVDRRLTGEQAAREADEVVRLVTQNAGAWGRRGYAWDADAARTAAHAFAIDTWEQPA